MKNWGSSFLFLFIMALCPDKGMGLDIRLFDEVGLRTSTLLLSKVGDLFPSAGDPPFEQLAKIPLINFPKKPIFLGAEDIQRILSSRYGVSARIIGRGVRVYPLYTRILNPEIMEKIKIELHKIYPHLPINFIDIMIMKSLKIEKIPAGNLDFKLWIPAGRKDITKYVRLEITSDGREVINVSFPIRIIFNIPIWKNKVFLRRGNLLKRKDFIMIKKNQLTEPKDFIAQTRSPFGRHLKTNLPAGQILYWKYTRK